MQPYYQTDRATLYHGDCLAVLPGLAAGSVDLILADLPYGTTACAWDSVIPLDKLWTEYKRVLKPRGAVVLTASQPFTSILVASNLDWFDCEWIWEKDRGSNFLNAPRQPMKEHESVLVFALGSHTYNPIRIPRTAGGASRVKYKPSRANKVRSQYNGGIGIQNTWTNPDGRGPRSILPFNRETGLHPTQKPVALGRYFVRTYSNPGDVVLDNTMGVGSFVVAAIEEGRRAIGIERAPDPTTADDYCAIAGDRLLAAEAARGFAVPTEAARRPLQLGLALDVA